MRQQAVEEGLAAGSRGGQQAVEEGLTKKSWTRSPSSSTFLERRVLASGASAALLAYEALSYKCMRP